MRRSNCCGLCTLLAAMCLTACSSNVEVFDITHQAPDAPVAGVPFRVPETVTLRVYRRTAKGTYEQVHEQLQNLPDPDRLFAVSFGAKQLADNTLQLEFNPNGTLTVLDLTNAQKADEAITALAGKGLGAVEALSTIEEQRRAKELELLTQQKSLETVQAELAALQATPTTDREAAIEAALTAMNAAELAAVALDSLPADATEAERAGAKGALRMARLQANIAYRRAGLPEPFPGVFP